MAGTVLVADDSPTIQNRAQSILRAEGFVVETVSNGVAAIKKLPKVLPDVVLADISMPGKDGFEVCEFIKNSPEFRRVSVLLIASDMEPYDELHAKRVRADGKVMKPFNPQQLVSVVSKFADLAQIVVPAPETERALMPGPSPDAAKTVATPGSLAEALPTAEDLGKGGEQKAGISPPSPELTAIEEPESQPQSALPPEVSPAPARPDPSLDGTAFSSYTPATVDEAGWGEKPATGPLESPVVSTEETLPEAQPSPAATPEPAWRDTDAAFGAASPAAEPAQAESPAAAPSPSVDQSRLEEVTPEDSRQPPTQAAVEPVAAERPLETPSARETPPGLAEPIQVTEVAPATLDQTPAAQEAASVAAPIPKPEVSVEPAPSSAAPQPSRPPQEEAGPEPIAVTHLDDSSLTEAAAGQDRPAPDEPEASPVAEAEYTPPPLAAPPLDAELVFSIVHRAVEKMSPPALAPEIIEEITRKLCEEIRRELNLGPTP